jgi:hypothetical protein
MAIANTICTIKSVDVMKSSSRPANVVGNNLGDYTQTILKVP